MMDYDKFRNVVGKGLKDYLQTPVIRSNQDESPDEDTYISYTVTTLMSANNGTYGAYEDGVFRKAVTQIWSVSAISSDNTKSVTLAMKAREWLDHVGTTYLSDNGIVVQSVGGITNRDNYLTAGYEYKNGFDVTFWLYDEIRDMAEHDGTIETTQTTINGKNEEYKKEVI